MIQRIQTLFILAAVVLLTAMFFLPLAKYIDGNVYYTTSVILLFLMILCTAISFITIFLYRHRMIQIRLCIFNIILLIGFQSFVAYCLFTAKPGGVFSFTAIFPLIAAILTFLALRYIARDEAMIKALNRLR